MKLAYETLEIWQLALIAEGYGRRTPPDRAHFMDQAIASDLEGKTAYQISVKKGYVTKSQFEKLISPLIEKIHFKTIGFKKYLLKGRTTERSDQPTQPNVVINQLPQAKRSRGFTLIELLVVIGIFGIISVIGTSMFFSILKGSTKTRVLAEVKQNGNYAISVMGRMIRNAKEIENCPGSSIRIVNPDEETTQFDLSGPRIASISALGTGYLTSDKVEIDTTKPHQFDCVLSSGSPPVVTIRFTLSQSGTAARPEEEATVDFKTTVSLRTY